MTDHRIGTREEWLAARLELLEAEKELTKRGDELARWRQELPWVRIDKSYAFDTDEGSASLADLFRGRSHLLVDRRRVRRLRGAPRESRRHTRRGVARSAAEAAGLQAPNGLGLSLGV